MNEITVRNHDAPLSVEQVRSNINLIQKVMQDCMKDGIHYGKIPGCGDKPALLKAGAEKIMATFQIAADPVVEDLSSDDVAHYRVRVNGVSKSGIVLGGGVGECSSDEDKYKWKRATCDAEWDEAPETRRREKWMGGKQPYKVKQIRTNPADVANTVLKMAKKRALIDMVLTVTAASDIFSQDIDEDDVPREQSPTIQPPQRRAPQPPPEEYVPVDDIPYDPQDVPQTPPAPAPQRQQQNGTRTISDKQAKRFWALAKGGQKSDDQIRAKLNEHGIDRSANIPSAIYEDLCAWAQS